MTAVGPHATAAVRHGPGSSDPSNARRYRPIIADRRRVCGLLKENRPADINSMLREMQHSEKIRRQGLQSALHGHSSLPHCRHR